MRNRARVLWTSGVLWAVVAIALLAGAGQKWG